MSNTRRAKQNRSKLKVIREDQQSATAEVAALREALAAEGAPAEVLLALDGARDVEEALRQLEAAGMMPSPENTLTGLMDSWKPLLDPACDPLSAELAGCEFLGMVSQAAPPDAPLQEILADLIEDGERHGGPEALAMMRALAAAAPEDVRSLAMRAADRLVAGGVADPPWVAALGSAKVASCFGYADARGAQESVAVTFAYGRKKHVFTALIDHDLGGGIKDCWVTNRARTVRNAYEDAARQLGLRLREYEPGQARVILDRALAQQPCPVDPSQIADVRDYLELLRRRVAALPAGDTEAPASPHAGARRRRTAHTVKITLRGSKPPIWRRLEVPSGITLDRLHEAVQAAFGWQQSHLWVFDTPSGELGIPDPELGHGNAARTRLADVAPEAGDRILYTYDFGDNWEHVITVEDVAVPEPGVAYPRCTAGRRACPPEDSGGMWGYEELMGILADPDHEEHSDRLEWLGVRSPAEFDPALFDRDQANAALAPMTKVMVKSTKRR